MSWDIFLSAVFLDYMFYLPLWVLCCQLPEIVYDFGSSCALTFYFILFLPSMHHAMHCCEVGLLDTLLSYWACAEQCRSMHAVCIGSHLVIVVYFTLVDCDALLFEQSRTIVLDHHFTNFNLLSCTMTFYDVIVHGLTIYVSILPAFDDLMSAVCKQIGKYLVHRQSSFSLLNSYS